MKYEDCKGCAFLLSAETWVRKWKKEKLEKTRFNYCRFYKTEIKEVKECGIKNVD